MEMGVGPGDFYRDWIQDPDDPRYNLNIHLLNEWDGVRSFLKGGRSEGRCCNSMHKLPGVLQKVQSGVCEVETICEFDNGSKSRECIVVSVMISIFYLIICISFNLLLWTYPSLFVQLPLLGMWRWLTMCLSLYIFTQSMRIPWTFPYWQSPTILFISASSYIFFYLPLSPTPYPYDRGSTDFHCDGHMLASPL